MKIALVNFLIHNYILHINTFNTAKHLNHTIKVKRDEHGSS